MRKELVVATEQNGLDVRSCNYIFTVFDEQTDLLTAIKKAVAAYVNTNAGIQKYQQNCDSFNWGDLDSIPNSYLRQFGFEKDDFYLNGTIVDFNEQLVSGNDIKFSDEKWELLKRELFMNGTEALEEFIGVLDENLENDSIENMLDQIGDQMSNEELLQFYTKYCLAEQAEKERRIQKLLSDMEDVQVYLSGDEELEMDYTTVEIDGIARTGWFACRYNHSCSTVLLEYSDQPIITDEEIEEYNIDIRQIFNDHSIAYCG